MVNPRLLARQYCAEPAEPCQGAFQLLSQAYETHRLTPHRFLRVFLATPDAVRSYPEKFKNLVLRVVDEVIQGKIAFRKILPLSQNQDVVGCLNSCLFTRLFSSLVLRGELSTFPVKELSRKRELLQDCGVSWQKKEMTTIDFLTCLCGTGLLSEAQDRFQEAWRALTRECIEGTVSLRQIQRLVIFLQEKPELRQLLPDDFSLYTDSHIYSENYLLWLVATHQSPELLKARESYFQQGHVHISYKMPDKHFERISVYVNSGCLLMDSHPLSAPIDCMVLMQWLDFFTLHAMKKDYCDALSPHVTKDNVQSLFCVFDVRPLACSALLRESCARALAQLNLPSRVGSHETGGFKFRAIGQWSSAPELTLLASKTTCLVLSRFSLLLQPCNWSYVVDLDLFSIKTLNATEWQQLKIYFPNVRHLKVPSPLVFSDWKPWPFMGLCSLDFSPRPGTESAFNNKKFSAFTSIQVPTLTSADLSGTKAVSSEHLMAFFSNHPSLTTVRLANCSQVSDRSLECLIRSYGQKIAHLVLNNCQKLTSKGIVEAVKQMPCLQELEVSGILSVNNRTVRDTLNVSPQLRSLDVSHCHQVTGEFGAIVQGRHEGLAKLSCSGLTLGQPLLNWLLEVGTKLEELTVGQLVDVPTDRLVEFVQRMKKLKLLDLGETVLTSAEIAALQNARPGLVVKARLLKQE